MSETAQPTPVFFSDETALRIVRAACDRRIALPKARFCALPKRAPFQREVWSAIEAAEALIPGLRLARPVHVLVGSKAHCHTDGLRVSHTCTAVLAPNSFYRLSEGVFACAPPLAFAGKAAWGANDVGLLQLGFELCGTYNASFGGARTEYDRRPLTTVDHLREYALANASLKGARTVVRLARYLADGSASPRETQMALLLGLPRARGGAGLGTPQMNYEVMASREAALIAQRASFRCDLCWPQARLDVEYQSREVHGNESSRIGDSRRANALDAMGWKVVGVTNDELDSVPSFVAIVRTIERHLGKAARPSVDGWYDRMLGLRVQLGLPIDSWLAR